MNKSEEIQIQSGAAGPVGRWCVVESNSHEERTAKFHLERKRFEVYLPLRASLSKRSDARRSTPLFPGYLFVAVDREGFCWGEMFGAIGVRSVLSAGDRPKLTPLGLIERIKGREVYGLVAMDSESVKAPHARGDKVKVIKGAFEAFDAIFDEPVDAKRVMVFLQILGGQTRVTLPARYLKAAS